MTTATTIDPASQGRVPTGMARITRTLLVSLLAALLAAACGPKSSGKKTTPGAKDGDTAGMDGKGPDGDGKGSGDGAPGADDGKGDDGGGDSGDGGGDDGDGAVTSGPKIEPPALDMSDQEKKARVDGSLARARAALAATNRDPNLAIQEAKAALSVDPNSVDAVVVLAHAYYFRKLYDTASVLLDRVLDSNVDLVKKRAHKHAGLYYVYGLVFDKTGEPARATFAYETARNLAPENVNVLMNLGVHYLRDSRYADARDIYEKLTGPLGVRSAAAWTNLGSAYRGLSASGTVSEGERVELLKKAETSYKRAIDVDKNYAPGYYDLALLYMDAKPFPLGGGVMDEMKRLDQARTYFKEYRALPGTDTALVDERLQQIDKAVKREQKARDKKAKDAEKAKKKKEGGDDDW